MLLLLSLLVFPAYVSKSQKSAVFGLELAQPVCPFCQMAVAVDTTTAAMPQLLDGPSAASAPAAAAAAVCCCCCGAALTLSYTYMHVLCLLLCSAMPYYRIPILHSTLAFSSPTEEFRLFFFDRKHSRVRAKRSDYFCHTQTYQVHDRHHCGCSFYS